MYANKNISFTKILKIILFHQKSQNGQFCPVARIEMSIMNSHLVENVLAKKESINKSHI